MRIQQDVKTIGLIGSGHIGSTVAKLAVAAGFDVVLSNSRGPETLAALVSEIDGSRQGRNLSSAIRVWLLDETARNPSLRG